MITKQNKKRKYIAAITAIAIIAIGSILYVKKQNMLEKGNHQYYEESYQQEDNTKAFYKQYKLAVSKLQTLTLEQKIGQMLLVSYDKNNVTSNYGGILFFEKDFTGKTEAQVKTMISNLKSSSNIPLLTAVDEEGKTGDKGVIRVSSNKNLTYSNSYLKAKQFQNAQTLYQKGGFALVNTDTIEKSKFLYNLGLNLNLAPVADICKEADYMYDRSVGLNTAQTSNYIQTVIKASLDAKKQGYEVSYCLKHFPGYGSNSDTHIGFSVDTRNLEKVRQDMASFEAGIKCGAEAVMISHNIVSSIETDDTPASLSPKINSLLRDDLHFTGIIMTDALNMKALDDIKQSKYVKAVLAGNDMLIVTEGDVALNDIKTAVENKQISEETINEAVARILVWKYFKNMF